MPVDIARPITAHAIPWPFPREPCVKSRINLDLIGPRKHGAGTKQGPWGQSAERAGRGLQVVLQETLAET